ncbi:hypothetical protein AC578_5328 [Pseudocercospora eumusae]|uniref:Uncharacterized protein n=1 Tax=Pseudocercospora eumusae TaxID=321146 RepID=A0A139GUI5_9PEZI|nr:hypothetical protein AC578_5328 [Pseudocercospora eumusae]
MLGNGPQIIQAGQVHSQHLENQDATHSKKKKKTMADPLPCYLLEKTSPELRNRIYELAFAPEDEVNDADEVSLCKAKSPPKDLILTCRQIHREAAKMYKAEHQRYWKSTKFFLCGHEANKNPEALHALQEEDLEHVTRLRTVLNNVLCSIKLHFLPECRAWEWQHPGPGGEVYFMLPTFSVREGNLCVVGQRHFRTYDEMVAVASANTRRTGSIKDQVLWIFRSDFIFLRMTWLRPT